MEEWGIVGRLQPLIQRWAEDRSGFGKWKEKLLYRQKQGRRNRKRLYFKSENNDTES